MWSKVKRSCQDIFLDYYCKTMEKAEKEIVLLFQREKFSREEFTKIRKTSELPNLRFFISGNPKTSRN